MLLFSSKVFPGFMLLVAGLTFATSFGACNSDSPRVDCETAVVPSFADLTVFTNSCNSCHSSTLTGGERHGAPRNIDYDTYEAAVAAVEAGMQEVANGAMPTGGVALSSDDEDQLFIWGQCGTPP